jgi:hypothetical protein
MKPQTNILSKYCEGKTKKIITNKEYTYYTRYTQHTVG